MTAVKFLEGIPDILYKYRDWTNPYNQKLLTHRELYFASFDQFNDPFDGTIPYRYNPSQLTEDNIFLKYYTNAKRDNPKWTEEQIHKHCYEYQKRGLLKDETYNERFAEETKKEINSLIGIVSLTTERNNFLMWSHYSNSHTGFVVGFDKYLLFEQVGGALGPVTYQTDLPLLDLFEEPPMLFRKLICTKSTVWNYENEFRLYKTKLSRQTITLVPETFSEIIFGCKMSFKQKTELLKLIEGQFPKATVHETILNKSTFKLDTLQLR